MKRLLTIIALMLCLSAPAQEVVQLSGVFHSVQRGDSVLLTIWARGKLIDQHYYTGPFYSTSLGGYPVFNLLFTSGTKEKECTLFTANMRSDQLVLDVDFAIRSDAIIKKPNANRDIYLVETIDSRGNFRISEYKQINTGDNRR